jgi:hypothetical protein
MLPLVLHIKSWISRAYELCAEIGHSGAKAERTPDRVVRFAMPLSQPKVTSSSLAHCFKPALSRPVGA